MDILVVDDEPISLRMAEHTLLSAGYQVATAADGEEALDLLRQQRHQIVVSDWAMPRMNGLELCRAIRSGMFQRYIYLIMVTGNNRPEDTVEGLRAGADDYVAKPFNPAELIMRVNAGRRIIGLETREMTIFAMAKLAESRDCDTGAHLERVRSYCRVLGARLRGTARFRKVLSGAYVELIYQTSPLHDIGKVAIPDSVLLKPGRLTAEEFEVMKTHTTHGAATLEAAMAEFPNTPFLEMARDVALGHHERYDGRGYPRGLAGNAIPLSARIMAIADVYDALTSRRVYKEAFPHDVARTMIADEAGKQFDPDIVAAFLAEENAFVAIREQFAEMDRSARGSIVPLHPSTAALPT